MAMTETGTQSGVEAEINYVRNPPGPDDNTLRFVTEAEENNTMITRPGRPMLITSGRGLTTDLDREGFVFARHVSAVADFHQIQEDPAVDQQYIDETAAFLVELTGASRVIMQGGGKKRYGEPATDRLAALSNAKPARYPHADNTDTSALELAQLMDSFIDDLDLSCSSRYSMLNVWRTFSRPPQDFPLAVCDAQSIAPGDEVTVTAITEERNAGEIIHDTTGYVYNPGHRWYYFPDMTIDEVIVFKSHDSDPTRARRVAHTAFTDPTCPPGVPTRASVEMRALALFD
jgi:hypothetical protein